MSHLLDITRTLGRDSITWPGDAPFQSETIAAIVRGDAWAQLRLALTDHTGTHLDAPAHFIDGAQTIAQLPLERLCGVRAHVVSIPPSARAIAPEHLRALAIAPGEAVLFKTANSDLPRDRMVENYCYLSVEAAKGLAEMNAGVVGVDYLSPDPYDSTDFPVHRLLLGKGIWILEDIDLSAVAPGVYRLWCLPLKIAGASGGPCRAVLESVISNQ